MKVTASLVIFCWFISGLPAQEKKSWEVGRLCGKLEHVEGKRPGSTSISEKRKGLRDVEIALYERNENQSCCNGVPIEEIRTRRGGRFEFQSKKPGNFWFFSSWGGNEYKLPIVYKPTTVSADACSEQGIQLDDAGNADWWITVTVD